MSKHGVGFSVGVKGLRLGTGPRGTYIRGGRGGIYYQRYLTKHVATIPAAVSRAQYASLGTPTEFIAEQGANDDDALSEINRHRAAFRYSLVFLAAIILCAGLMAASNAFVGWYALVIASIAYCIFLYSQENIKRSVTFQYGLDNDIAVHYRQLAETFKNVAQCERTWRIVSQTTHSDRKRNAGATSSVERIATAFMFGGMGAITTNVNVTSLEAAGTRLFFLPDRIVTITGPRVGSISYADLRIENSDTRFSENQPVPSDSTCVGTTWLYVNRDGSPDKRFKNNRQLPIVLYSDLELSHPSLALKIEFSRSDAASNIAGALRRFITALTVDEAPSKPVSSEPSMPVKVRPQILPVSTVARSSVASVQRLVDLLRAMLIPLRSAHTAASSANISPYAQTLSPAESILWVEARIHDAAAFMPNVISLCSTELRRALNITADGAFSEALQNEWSQSYKMICARLTSWETVVGSVSLAPKFRCAHELMRGLTTEYLDAIASVPDKLSSVVAGSGDANVNTSIKMERLVPLRLELERLSASQSKDALPPL